MFCPKCGMFLHESDLVQRNVKYAMGNVPVEYDARCPNCKDDIGRMSWGQFTVNPELSPPNYKDDPKEEPKESLIPPPPEMRRVLRPYGKQGRGEPPVAESDPVEEPSAEEAPEPAPRICPHCGQLWPEEPVGEEGESKKYG